MTENTKNYNSIFYIIIKKEIQNIKAKIKTDQKYFLV